MSPRIARPLTVAFAAASIFALVGVAGAQQPATPTVAPALPPPPTAAVPKPTPFMQGEVKRVRDLLKVKVKKGSKESAEMDVKLKAVIDPVLEFEKMSERALRKHWPTLTEAQRTEFIETFRELVYRSYLKRVRSADENYTMVWEDEEKAPPGAHVTAIAKTKKAEIELVFQLAVRDGKRWVAEDIVIDEVSLVENYREQFNRIISKDGFDALIKKMKKKLAEF